MSGGGKTASKVVAVIPAAGRGTRMPGIVPKQFRPILGRPVLWHTLRCFEETPSVGGIIVAVNPADRARYEAFAGDFGKLRPAVEGGRERGDSVRFALGGTTEEDEIVLVHDAVRPLVTRELIDRVIEETERSGAAIPALPATETVKEVRGGVIVGTPDRRSLWNAQTPQGFSRNALLQAFDRAAAGTHPATDEATLLERMGVKVRIVAGDSLNIKLTTPEDFEKVEWNMDMSGREKNADSPEPTRVVAATRVGQGYDVHRLVPGKPLILGGVTIPHPAGLDGHSDADVLSHAIIDALLGAAALGDIGRHFPDHDEAYRGISSLLLLAQVRGLLDGQGIRVVNVDAVVMAQEPKLAPHMDTIRGRLAEALRIPVESVSVKATTTEGLGFTGRSEGMAAQAVAQVEK